MEDAEIGFGLAVKFAKTFLKLWGNIEKLITFSFKVQAPKSLLAWKLYF